MSISCCALVIPLLCGKFTYRNARLYLLTCRIYILSLAFYLIKNNLLLQFIGSDNIDFILSLSVPPGGYLGIFFLHKSR